MPFLFRNQPFKTIYLLCTTAVLVVRLPLWILKALIPPLRPRPTWGAKRTLYTNLLQVLVGAFFQTSFPAIPEPDKSKHVEGFVWVDPVPTSWIEGEIKELARFNGIQPVRTSGYWYGRGKNQQGLTSRAFPHEKVVYHVHGGGFVMGSASRGDAFTPVVCEGLLARCQDISRVFCIEYRLASTAPFAKRNAFPAALIDILSGYAYLVRGLGFEPENIIVSGESVGGSLALALTRYITSTGIKGLPKPPIGLLLMSPVGDWGNTHVQERSSFYRNMGSDFGGPFYDGYPTRAVLGNLPPWDAYHSSWISPASLRLESLPVYSMALPRQFPHVFIISGEAEMQLDSIRTLKDRLVADLGDDGGRDGGSTAWGEGRVRYLEVYGASHSFLALRVFEPERSETLSEISEWMQKRVWSLC